MTAATATTRWVGSRRSHGGSDDDTARRGSDDGGRTATPDIAESPTAGSGPAVTASRQLAPSTASGSPIWVERRLDPPAPGRRSWLERNRVTTRPAAPAPTTPAPRTREAIRPRVTVGNGRSPGILSDDPEPRWQAPALPTGAYVSAAAAATTTAPCGRSAVAVVGRTDLDTAGCDAATGRAHRRPNGLMRCGGSPGCC